MRFGLILSNYGASASPDTLLAEAGAAEAFGFDSAWTTDHVFLPRGDAGRFGRILEALVCLAYLAGRTQRLRLGVSSLVLPQREPVLAAKQLASLDVLASGRLIVCVGIGWSAGEYKNLGARFSDRGRRMEEATTALRALLQARNEEPLSFPGRFYAFADGVFSPPPIQSGGPPLWMAGNSEAAIRRAARLADVWHPSGVSPDQIRQAMSILRSEAPGRSVGISLRLRVSFDPETTNARICGSPDVVRAALDEYREAGVEYAVLDFQPSDPARRLHEMERFSREVMPRLQASP